MRFVGFALPNFNQAELLLPSLLDELKKSTGQSAFLDERACLTVRALHDVAIADEIARPQLRQA
jgi:hypothetical protein